MGDKALRCKEDAQCITVGRTANLAEAWRVCWLGRPLLARIQNGEIDPSFIITHRLRLEDAPRGYEMFRYTHDKCIKVVLKPHASVGLRPSSFHQ